MKPENIVLEGGKAGGRVFLVDFGGVQAAAMQNEYASTIIGNKVHAREHVILCRSVAVMYMLQSNCQLKHRHSSAMMDTSHMLQHCDAYSGSQLYDFKQVCQLQRHCMH